jgi:hypothetical protein
VPRLWQTGPISIRLARAGDVPAFLALAAQVEKWFGPMVEEPGFHRALATQVSRGTALVAADGEEPDLLGGLLFGAKPPTYHVH